MCAECLCEACCCNAEVDGGLGGPGHVGTDGAGGNECACLEELAIVGGEDAGRDGGCAGEPFRDVLRDRPGCGVAVDGEGCTIVLDWVVTGGESGSIYHRIHCPLL